MMSSFFYRKDSLSEEQFAPNCIAQVHSIGTMYVHSLIQPIFAEIPAILTNNLNYAAEWMMKDHPNGGDYLQAGWLG